MEEREECTDCPMCDPYNYIATVDIGFLKMCKLMYENLSEQAPNYCATGWIKQIEKKIQEALDSHNPS